MLNNTTTLPETMIAVRLIGHGGPEMLQYVTDQPLPALHDDDVLVKVAAAGVNNTDINTRTGWYSKGDHNDADAGWNGNALQLPRIQGADVCGQIVAVGRHVDSSRIGQRVLIEPCIRHNDGQALAHPWYFGSECDGGFAGYTKVASVHAHAITSPLSDVELASFPCSYSTAENLLTKAAVQRGDRVLITGASGGVGSAAIQLAKARGAQVIALTSAAKAAELQRIGADRTVERSQSLLETLGCNQVDVVIDLVAGQIFPQLLEVLKPHGRYAVAGAIGGAEVSLDVRTLYLKDLSFYGCTVLEPEVFANLVKRIEAGQLQPLVAHTFALAEISQAQALFQQKGHIGKIVLKVD
ncbi:alcohol dehydrogenase family protein [Ferrimonas senticii]|uniref:alcohol dehydrogenase family protein n=1 Tax=Ferrimonas senticii TaxID=394566 RepID=UPI0004261705|nr:alcohol dehydrogenase family protein [Ferrimonas senticii]